MARGFGQKSGVKLPQRGREAKREQFGRQPKELVLCPKCRNIRFEKRWLPADKAEGLENFRSKKGMLKRELCPACTMIENHVFEGEIFIAGFPKKYQTELLHLLRAFGKIAEEKDPQDRIIGITQSRDGWHVTTTEDEMAVRLARKIQSAYKLVDLSIS